MLLLGSEFCALPVLLRHGYVPTKNTLDWRGEFCQRIVGGALCQNIPLVLLWAARLFAGLLQAGVLFGTKLLYIGLSSTFSSAHDALPAVDMIATKSKRALSKRQRCVLEKKHKLGNVRAFFNLEYYNKERIDFN